MIPFRPRRRSRFLRHFEGDDEDEARFRQFPPDKRRGAKAAENCEGKPVTVNALFSERIRIRNALRLFAFSASLRLFRPNSSEWFRPSAPYRLGTKHSVLLPPGRLVHFAGG
jgi:hypothetical protein